MFAIVLEQPIKLQSGLWYARVEKEQRTHSGDETAPSSGFFRIILMKQVLNVIISYLQL